MKKLICLLLALMIVMAPIPAQAAEQAETSLTTGDRNVLFTNGYTGFCIDRSLSGAYAGDSFVADSSTSTATDNTQNVDVSQALKVLFTQCFTDVFVSDGNGGYVISDTNTVQAVVWHFTDGQYIWGVQKTLADKVKAYNGPAIEDHGYVLTLDNGDVITFSFVVMAPQKSGQQSFFAYKLTVGQQAPHAHEYGNTWSTDGTSHWRECDCGDVTDMGPHSGGKADCVMEPTCTGCQKTYGSKDPETHTGNTEIRNAKPATTAEAGYTGDTHCTDCGEKLSGGQEIPKLHSHVFGETWSKDKTDHWHECQCGEKQDTEKHIYQGGKCTVCQAADPNYTGETPHTGDGFRPGLWMALSLIGLSGCLWLVLYGRKKYLV